MKADTMGRISVLVVLGLALQFLWSEPPVTAQVVVTKREQATLGSVQVGVRKVSVLISYEADSALLVAVVPGSDGNPRYIPLIGSTYRGVSSFRLDVLSPDSGHEMWIRMSKPRKEVLAYYRFGDKTAVTPFGRIKLLETSYPEYPNGGPIPFPKKGSDASRIRASFYHYDDI